MHNVEMHNVTNNVGCSFFLREKHNANINLYK